MVVTARGATPGTTNTERHFLEQGRDMRKKPDARKLVRDFFCLPDYVAVYKDDGGNTYMTDRYAVVHVNTPAFPARWYANLDAGVYKLRATGDPVRDTHFTAKDREKLLRHWTELARITDWRPVEETPWSRGGLTQLLIRHDHDADRPAFADLARIDAFRNSAPYGHQARFHQPDGKPDAAIRVTAERRDHRTYLLGYLMPIRLIGPVGCPEATPRLHKQAAAVMAAYQRHPDRK